jgi:hypothetical protein
MDPHAWDLWEVRVLCHAAPHIGLFSARVLKHPQILVMKGYFVLLVLGPARPPL